MRIKVGTEVLKQLEPRAFGSNFHNVHDAPVTSLLGRSFNGASAVSGEVLKVEGAGLAFDEPALSERDVLNASTAAIPRFSLPSAAARELQVRGARPAVRGQ